MSKDDAPRREFQNWLTDYALRYRKNAQQMVKAKNYRLAYECKMVAEIVEDVLARYKGTKVTP